MRVKGSLLKTRWEFLHEHHGPDAQRRVLDLLPEPERRQAETALSGSWIPFALATQVDEAIVACFGGGQAAICSEIGAYSARRNLATLYRVFVEQAQHDPLRLLEQLALLHGTLYDWGSSQATRLDDSGCVMEADYGGAATRLNCLSAVGFYREALCLLKLGEVTATERGCQAEGAARCAVELRWRS